LAVELPGGDVITLKTAVTINVGEGSVLIETF